MAADFKTDPLFGKKAKDKVTGFSGIIIGKCEYLYGCTQYGISPEAKDGKVNDTHWFDEGRIEIIDNGVRPEEVKAKKNGGPSTDAPKGVH
jgi:hypothetical protein